MRSNNSNGSRASPAWGFMALFAIMLAMGLALAVSPAEAAPFAYVANANDNTVSVIDTGANPPVVVGTPISVGSSPYAVAGHPGRETCLCHELVVQQCFGDRDDRQHSDDHGRGGVYPPGGRRHPG
jgi:YVTN family beta-propeller protein